ncbi:MAG: glycosyltransferase family 2 protein [Planctomycetota bacterium]
MELPQATNHRPFIVSVSLVKNEQDIIESFVRHNLQFLDAMVVVDNQSADATREILVALAREGLPVIVTDDPIQAYHQQLKTSRVARAVAQQFAPDYLCILDADEFLMAPSRDAFEAALSTIPYAGQGMVTWRQYVLPPTPAPTGELEPMRLVRHRLRDQRQEWYKCILSVPGLDLDRLRIVQGNHGATYGAGEQPPDVRLDGIALAHIPVRSAEQLTAKVVVGRMAYYALAPHCSELRAGSHWDKIYRQLLTQGSFDDRQVAEISLHYSRVDTPESFEEATIEDPLPCRHTLHYTEQNRESPLVTITKSWEGTVARPIPMSDQTRQLSDQRRRAFEALPEATRTQAGTSFDPTWHFERIYGDLPPFRYLFGIEQPQSVLDLGCGLGVYLLYAHFCGVKTVVGVDGFPGEASLVGPGAFRQHNLAEPLRLGHRFDLVMCLEVAEHLPPDAAQVLLETIAAHANDAILFSAADVGQAGNGHINCRPISDWLEAWDALGWEPDGIASFGFRALSTLSWFCRNPMVLRRKGSGRVGTGPTWTERVAAHGRRPWRWWNQDASVIEHPFLDPIPVWGGPVRTAATASTT